jgi:STE24 endopeptidase
VPNEDKATRYHRSRRRAAGASLAATGGFLGLALGSGLSAAVRDGASALGGGTGVAAALAYGLVMATFVEILRLPYAYYAGVTLESRYGLSTQPAAQWWRDELGSAGVTVGLTAVAAGVVFPLIRWAPSTWWLLATVLLAGAFLAAAQMVPAMLRPREQGADAHVRPALTDRLHQLAKRCRTPVTDISVWRVSARTRKASARLVGLGRWRQILLSDTLLDEHGDDEVEVIVAHELAHVVHGDAWVSLAVQIAMIGTGCYVADELLAASIGPLGLESKADLAGLPVVALAAGVVSHAWRPASNLLSQFQERRADRFAIETTRDAGALVKALRHIGSVNLAEDRPSRLADRFLHTHPSITSRIEAAERLSRERFRREPPLRPQNAPTFTPTVNVRPRDGANWKCSR